MTTMLWLLSTLAVLNVFYVVIVGVVFIVTVLLEEQP